MGRARSQEVAMDRADITILMSQAREYKVLSAAEVDTITRRMGQLLPGPRTLVDEREYQALRQRMIMSNIRLVLREAWRCSPTGQKIADLVQVGLCGLTRAVDEFDPNRGCRFSTYAVWWIKSEILQYVLADSTPVKPPRNQFSTEKLFYNLRKATAKLAAQGKDTSDQAMAKYFKMPVAEITNMRGLMESAGLSLNQRVFLDTKREVTTEWHEMFESTSNVEEEGNSGLLSLAIRKTIHSVMNRLSPLEQDILMNRLYTEEPHTLADVGKRHDRTKERVRQVELKLKDRLTKHLSKYVN